MTPNRVIEMKGIIIIFC